MKHKYKLTIVGTHKTDNQFFVSISGKWKANNLQEAITMVEEKIKDGDYDFYGCPQDYNIVIKPTDDVYFVGVKDNGLCRCGEENDKLYIYTNKTDIDES